MAVEFTTSNAASQSSGVKCLVHGRSGVGKTLLCSTAPAPLIISAESGLLSLSKANIERVFGADNPHICYDVPVAKVNNVEDLAQVFQWCQAHAWSSGIRTIHMDSISEIMEQVLSNAKRQVKDPRKAYGELIDKGQDLVRKFRDLPGLNVVVLAKQEGIKDDLTGVTRYGPSVPGSKLGQSLPYFFDEVFHLGINKDTAGKEYRFLQTQPDLQFEAKDRSGMLDPVEYPHLGAVFRKVLNA